MYIGNDAMPSYTKADQPVGIVAGNRYDGDKTKQSEIPAMMDRLQGRLTEMEQAMAAMEQRLGPIMRPEPQQTNAASVNGVAASTGLGCALHVAGDRVGMACEKMCTILRLLEL